MNFSNSPQSNKNASYSVGRTNQSITRSREQVCKSFFSVFNPNTIIKEYKKKKFKNEERNPCNLDLNFLIEIYLENRTHFSFSKSGFQKLNPNFPIEHTNAFHMKCIIFNSFGTSPSYSLLQSLPLNASKVSSTSVNSQLITK